MVLSIPREIESAVAKRTLLRRGIPTVRGYNAPCFERMVHYFMGSVLMRWDNEDGKDKIVLLSQKSSLCRG